MSVSNLQCPPVAFACLVHALADWSFVIACADLWARDGFHHHLVSGFSSGVSMAIRASMLENKGKIVARDRLHFSKEVAVLLNNPSKSSTAHRTAEGQ